MDQERRLNTLDFWWIGWFDRGFVENCSQIPQVGGRISHYFHRTQCGCLGDPCPIESIPTCDHRTTILVENRNSDLLGFLCISTFQGACSVSSVVFSFPEKKTLQIVHPVLFHETLMTTRRTITYNAVGAGLTAGEHTSKHQLIIPLYYCSAWIS